MKNETLLIGLDIYKYVKSICYEFSHLGETPDMTEREGKAYKAGIDLALSILDQTLNEMLIENDGEFVIHVPDHPVIEEFYSVDEIVERMKEV